MAGRGLATLAIVAVLLVVIAGAAVFGYMFLLPANKSSSTTTQSSTPSSTTAQKATPPSSDTVVISNAAISNNSLLLTVQNKGSEAVSLEALLVTPGAGCNLTSFSFSRTSASSSASSSQSGQNQSRIPVTIPTCLEAAVPFIVHSNSTLTPTARGQFNASGLFNFSSFNSSRSFSRSVNFSRSISGNFTRPPPGSNFSGFPGGAFGFFGNLSAGAGLEVAAGQSVTLVYSGPIGSGITAGSQYTIFVEGQLAEAQITVSAT